MSKPKLKLKKIVKPYKPMKACNEPFTLEDAKKLNLKEYAIFEKLDGIRMEVQDGKIYSNSGKPCPNPEVYIYFNSLLEFSKTMPECRLVGEFFSKELTFQEIFSYWSTFKTKKSLEDSGIKFYAFDYYASSSNHINYEWRFTNLHEILYKFPQEHTILAPIIFPTFRYSENELNKRLESLFNQIVLRGGEGLILRKLDSLYKFGRATLKEASFLKLKGKETSDAYIIGVVQGTKVDPDAEKTINELGYSVTSKKKEDRIPFPIAESFLVRDPNFSEPFKVSLTSMTDAEKENVWKIKNSLIEEAAWIEYESISSGVKNVPRSPKFIRYREAKEI